MDEINNPHGKLLFLAYTLHRQGRISLPQKDLLKIKILTRDIKIFQYLDLHYSSPNLALLEENVISYIQKCAQESLKQPQKSHTHLQPPTLEPSESAISNKAKKPSTESESEDSEDEIDEKEENQKSKKRKDRTKSEEIDLRRASFTDYYRFVKEDVYKTNSAAELEIENHAITEVKSQMEMSKMESPGNKIISPKETGRMQEFLPITIILLTIWSFPFWGSASRLKQAGGKEEKKNYPDVHVHMEPSVFDLKTLLSKSEDRRAQRNMLRDLEEKVALDRQAFQQITGIQNDEIQGLSEAIKLNSYYTMRKIINSKENKGVDNLPKEKKEMSFEKRMELVSNPFEVVKDEGMKELVDKIPKNRLETYGDVVDKIYGA